MEWLVATFNNWRITFKNCYLCRMGGFFKRFAAKSLLICMHLFWLDVMENMGDGMELISTLLTR